MDHHYSISGGWTHSWQQAHCWQGNWLGLCFESFSHLCRVLSFFHSVFSSLIEGLFNSYALIISLIFLSQDISSAIKMKGKSTHRFNWLKSTVNAVQWSLYCYSNWSNWFKSVQWFIIDVFCCGQEGSVAVCVAADLKKSLCCKEDVHGCPWCFSFHEVFFFVQSFSLSLWFWCCSPNRWLQIGLNSPQQT